MLNFSETIFLYSSSVTYLLISDVIFGRKTARTDTGDKPLHKNYISY